MAGATDSLWCEAPQLRRRVVVAGGVEAPQLRRKVTLWWPGGVEAPQLLPNDRLSPAS